jgi:hypothetical protein
VAHWLSWHNYLEIFYTSEVQYDQVRKLLRGRFLNILIKVEPDAEPIANLLADKLMALEFSRTFSKGIVNPSYTFPTSNYQQKFQRKALLLVSTIGITLFACLKICFLRNTNTSPKLVSSLVYGISPEHYTGTSDVENLGLYLDQHLEINGLTPPDFYLMQTGSLFANRDVGKVKMVPYIGIEMLKYQSIPKKAQVNNLCKRFLSLVRLSIALPEILEIGPAYILDYSVFSNVLHLEIRSLITTQSQMLVLPMVFYQEVSPNRLMFWYSDNSTQIQNLEAEKQEVPDYSYLIQNRISSHYVWTNSWAKLLKTFTHGKILVIGPILFKLPQESQSEMEFKPRSIKSVVIFDVTPKKSTSHNNFYYSSNMRQFLMDLVEIVHDLAPSTLLMLKPKRKYSDSDDFYYIRLIKSLSPRIKLLPPTQDLVSLIGDSDLVICAPFTSPALLAKSLGKQVFYYSPSVQFKLPLEYEGIQVISGKESLRQAIASMII